MANVELEREVSSIYDRMIGATAYGQSIMAMEPDNMVNVTAQDVLTFLVASAQASSQSLLAIARAVDQLRGT